MANNDLSPEEAFAQLGNETRVTIIRVLSESAEESLSFSELRDRVGTRDSGQFNYHLNQLIGTFLQRTEDGQYELAYAGRRVIGAILSGDFNQHGTAGTFRLDSVCAICDEQLEATYEDEQVAIQCPTCEKLRSRFGFPPGGFTGRTVEELTQAFDDWITGVLRIITDGICFNCAGKTAGHLTKEVEPPFEDEPVYIEFTCDRCNNFASMSVNSYLLLHPAVIAFYFNHGINVSEEHTWNLEFLLDGSVEVSAEDPLQVKSTIELGDERRTFVIDQDLSVKVD